MRIGRALVSLTALALVAAACGGGEVTEQLLEAQEGVGDVEIDENSGSVRLEVEDEEGGGSAVIGGGDIPADFPVPVPDGGEVMAVVTTGGDTSVSLAFPSGDFAALKSFYESWASGAGEIVNSMEMTDPNPAASWAVESGDTVYNVTLGDTGSEVALNIVVVSGG